MFVDLGIHEAHHPNGIPDPLFGSLQGTLLLSMQDREDMAEVALDEAVQLLKSFDTVNCNQWRLSRKWSDPDGQGK